MNEFYVSRLCDVDCNHHHRTPATAEKCAEQRIRLGELRRYCGDSAAGDDDDDIPAAMFVNKTTR